MDLLVVDLNKVQGRNNSHIAWDNVLRRGTVTSAVDSANLPNLHDYMTTSFWNPGVGSVDLDVTLPLAEDINCCAIAAGNWTDAGVSIKVYSDAGITLVGEVVGLKNGQPYMFIFDTIKTTTMRISFTSTGSLSIGQIFFGETLQMPTPASIGMKAGRFNNRDKIISQKTENNASGPNSTVSRSRETVAPYNLVPISFLENEWSNFVDSHTGRPVWFSWDAVNKLTDVTFGHWKSNDPRYTKSFFSQITLTVKGQI